MILRTLIFAALFSACSAFGATRAELEAKVTELRAWVVQLKAEADHLIAQRVLIIEEVAKTEAQIAAVEAQLVVLGSDVMRYWFTSDDGDGPSRSDWSRHLRISWKRPGGGDYLDANGVAQGTRPWATVATNAVGPLAIHLPDAQAVRKGILLRMSGKNYPYATFAGRLSATPPTLTVKLKDGAERTLPVLSLAGWNTSTYTGSDTRQSARLSAGTGSVLALFDIPADAVTATLNLQVVAFKYPGTISVFALDPPGVMYPHEHTPVPGIAATVADENALKSHPSVIRAGDFDLRKSRAQGGVFDGRQQASHAPQEYLSDPLDPTRIIYRSGFKQRDGSSAGDAIWRGSLSLTMSTMPADISDPMFPLAAPPNKEMFARMCFKLEDDWRARNDGNKLALGWNLRFGYWTKTGFWQETTGNGGAPGTGMKVLRTNKDGSKQWEYQGHSIRAEAGKGPSDPNHPHEALRPLEAYLYNLDQPGGYGNVFRWGNAVIERGRWHCMEQHIKINSIIGPFDANGNGQAVADGLLETWLDGVPVGRLPALRWHRHPEMGIEGPWINWYFGGKQASEVPMHYQMADMVLATEYIGLPNNFHLRNASNDAVFRRTGTK